MSTESNAAKYAQMVNEAEAAVTAVKDPELRRVAFEKILATMLEGGSARSESLRSKPNGKRSAGKSGAGTKRSTGKAKHGPQSRIEELIDGGFFKKQQTIAQVKSELANCGHHIALNNLSGPLQRLTRAKKLRRQKIAANKKGPKNTYAYSNW